MHPTPDAPQTPPPGPFDAYLPIDRRRALSTSTDGGAALPSRDQGTVLFLDISGFTPLTQALIQVLGPERGAEALIGHLNRVYELLIALVHRYGGSAIGFSGDAITCWFSQDRGVRAITVAIEAQRDIAAMDDVVVTAATRDGAPLSSTQDHSEESLRFPLSIKVAISCGPVRRFLVGSPQLMRLEALAGQTVDLVALAEHQAQRGEIVLTEEAAMALGEALRPSCWRLADGRRFAIIEAGQGDHAYGPLADPSPWPAITQELPQDVTEAWLPVAVRKRLRIQAFLAEFRPVVALFLRFGGIHYDDDEGAGEALSAYLGWVQQIVARYGGSILQLTFGDKGSYAYASFGAPVAYADNAVRAVAAALALAHPPPEFADITPPQLGLAAGSMCTGAYGSTQRRVYGVLGHKTNLAARLMMHAAPGEILCDQEVQRGASGTWEFLSLPAIQAKGVRGDVALFRPTGARHRAVNTLTQPLRRIGREDVFAQMRDSLDVIGACESVALMLEGEAGMGKSCLVSALVHEALEREMSVIIGAAQSIEQHTPYRAWREPMRALLRLQEDTSPSEQLERIREYFLNHLPDEIERLPLLGEILDLPTLETGWLQELAPELRQESLQSLLIALLRSRAAQGPLCVILEDAQWFDSLTWELLLHIARAMEVSLHGLLLVVTMRPRASQVSETAHASFYHQALAALSKQLTSVLPLHPMPASEIQALIAYELGCDVEDLSNELKGLLVQRAGGNPFFALELLRLLREKDILLCEDAPGGRRWSLPKGGELLHAATLPDSIEGLLLARIDQLPPQRQQILKVASVIGQSFPFGLLLHSLQPQHADQPDALRVQLAQLIDDSFATQGSGEENFSDYAFSNVTTRDVAYRTLLFQQRRQLHRTIALWYERTQSSTTTHHPAKPEAGEEGTDSPSSDVPPSHWPLLVYHWRHAQSAMDERRWAHKAGQLAATQHAHAEAVTYLNRALELTAAEESLLRYELLLLREGVYERSGHLEAQRADLAALCALAPQLPPEAQLQIRLREAHFAMLTASYEEAIAAASDAHTHARQADAPRFQAEALHLWGNILFKQADVEGARARFEASLEVAQHHQLQALEALSLNALGKCYWRDHQLDRGLALLEEALAQFRALADLRSEALVLNNIALVLGQQDKRDEAAAALQQARSTCMTLGDRRGEALVLGNLGMGVMESGRFGQAAEYLERALVLSREVGARDNEALVVLQLGDLAKRTGAYTQAQTVASEALALYEQIGHPFFSRIARLVLAECEHYTGNHQAAITQMQACLADGAADVDPQLAVEISLLLARALEATAQFSAAKAILEDARPWLEGIDPKITQHYQAVSTLILWRLDDSTANAALETLLPPLLLSDHAAMDGVVEPFELYLAALQVAQALHHPQAHALLQKARMLLQYRSELLDQTRLRTFLEVVPHHRSLAQLTGLVHSADQEQSNHTDGAV